MIKINLLVDNKNSWSVKYIKQLNLKLLKEGYKSQVIHTLDEKVEGDILFILSCEKIITKGLLAQHKNNIVIHGSDLPKGKGFSPITWQILENKNTIPLTLFECAEKVDAGVIYLKNVIKLDGYELVDEIRKKQWEGTEKLIYEYIENRDIIKGVEQQGKSTYYKRRSTEQSELDINKTIKEQFNLLRVSDNNRYPAFFKIDGNTYKLEISKELPKTNFEK